MVVDGILSIATTVLSLPYPTNSYDLLYHGLLALLSIILVQVRETYSPNLRRGQIWCIYMVICFMYGGFDPTLGPGGVSNNGLHL